MRTKTPTEPTKEGYRSYLLRLWCADAADTVWSASLEDLRTGERIGFANLEQLFVFLMGQVESDTKGGAGE